MKEHGFRVRVSSIPTLIARVLAVPCAPEQVYTMQPRLAGTCKSWLPEKKFGFITEDSTGVDYFVHFSQVNTSSQSLVPGDVVEFEIADSDKGKQAVKVSVMAVKPTPEFRNPRSPQVPRSSLTPGYTPAPPLRPAAAERRTGVCKSWRSDKKFGFLTDAKTGVDIFTHSSQVATINQELIQGDVVEFDIENTKKGQNAVAVTVVKRAAPRPSTGGSGAGYGQPRRGGR